MNLDVETLLWVLTLASAVLGLTVLAVAWRVKAPEGLLLWGVGLVVNALSHPAFGLRTQGWLETSIVLANLLTGLTFALHTLALMQFQKSRVRVISPWFVWTPLALNVLAAWLFLHDDYWRNVLTSTFQTVMVAVLLSQAWAPGVQAPRLTGRWAVVIGSSLMLATFVVRTLSMVFESRWDGYYNVPHHIQAGTYFFALAVMLTNSMGFVLMQMEDAISRQHKLAIHDQLTGLYNRHELLEVMAQWSAMSRRTRQPLAVLMLDIDHFKLVNDKYGHPVGDEVLREVAQRSKNCLRSSDFLARFGGEEFVALLPNTDAQGALVVAEAVRHAIEERAINVHGTEIPLTISIGVHASVPSDQLDATDVMIAASDRGLYKAKAQGRNRVVVE